MKAVVWKGCMLTSLLSWQMSGFLLFVFPFVVAPSLPKLNSRETSKETDF